MKKNREPNNTIEDVARHAGVSIKTVSRVLNSEPNVRQATRDKVLAAAQSMGYAPNISARRLAARRSFIVALVYRDDDVNYYIPDIQHGALDVCRERGYNLLLHPCQGSINDAAHEIEQLATAVAAGRLHRGPAARRFQEAAQPDGAPERAVRARVAAATAASCRRRSPSATAPGPIKWPNISRS